jgi:hypothetical protein
MALKVITAFLKDGKVNVTIEGDNPEAVGNPEARTLAMQYAAKVGYPQVGYSGTSGSYPVDAEGKEWEDMNKMALAGKIAAYRNDIILQPRL